MKKSYSTFRLFTTALGCALMIAATSRADDFVHFKGRPGSKVRIDGSANIHDWHMDGNIISGEFDVPANVTLDSSQAAVAGLSGDKLNAHATVRIPVNSMQSDVSSAMDAVMQDAMNAKDHPQIEYKLSEMTLKQPHAAGTPLQFDTKGDLTVNGVTKAITMPVSIETVDKTKMKITGGPVPILMTDYQVQPPTKAGIFTTHPDVKITFEWVVSLPKQA